MPTQHAKPARFDLTVASAIVAVLALAGFGAYFVLVSGGPLPMDAAWREAVQLTNDALAYPLAVFLAEFGSALGVAACGAIAAALFFSMRRGREGAALITALSLGVVLSESVKYAVARARPLDSVYVFSGGSFPSGHSMGAAALAVSLALALSSIHRGGDSGIPSIAVRWGWIAAAAWTVAMMWSRTALGVHWLSDVVAGGLLGLSTALVAHRLWCRRIGVDSQT